MNSFVRLPIVVRIRKQNANRNRNRNLVYRPLAVSTRIATRVEERYWDINPHVCELVGVSYGRTGAPAQVVGDWPMAARRTTSDGVLLRPADKLPYRYLKIKLLQVLSLPKGATYRYSLTLPMLNIEMRTVCFIDSTITKCAQPLHQLRSVTSVRRMQM